MNSEVIKQAMREGKQVSAFRDGQLRVFCPHIIGWTDGEYRTLVWQFGGYSSQGLPEGGAWRGFAINDLTEVKIIEGPWYRGWTKGRGDQHYVRKIEMIVAPHLAAEVRQTLPGHIPPRAPRRPGPQKRR